MPSAHPHPGSIPPIQYRDLVEHSAMGVMVHADNRIIYANNAYARLFGYPQGSDIVALVSPDLLAAPEELNRLRQIHQERLRRSGPPSIYEFQGLKQDGSRVWIENHVSTVEWEGTTVTQTFSANVTERRRIARALDDTGRQFRNLVEGSIQGILIHRDFEILFANEAYARLYGYDTAEDLIAHRNLLDFQSEDERKRVQEYYRRRMAGLPAPTRYEAESVKIDGTPFWVENLVTVVEWEDAPAVLVTEIDITDRILAHRKLIEANESKKEFLSHISHELRNPVTAIMGYTQLIRDCGNLSETQYRDLDVIESSTEHLLQLINNVLDFNRIESGKLAISTQPFDLGSELNSCVGMFRSACRAKGLQLGLSVAEDAPVTVLGDAQKIKQIIINLLGNAVKATESGGIDVSAKPAGTGVRFDIQDTGPGLPEVPIGSLREPYQNIGGPEENNQMGLGIAISIRLVELLGGKIGYSSEPGVGTRFWFEIPGRGSEDAEIAKPDSGRVTALALDGGEVPLILIVDDDEDNRLYLERRLGSLGFATATAENGVEALRRLQDRSPDAILMDLHMPVLDGIEATRRIRALGLSRQPVIIAVTAAVLSEQVEHATEAGCDEVIIKPYNEEALIELIGKRLDVRYVRA